MYSALSCTQALIIFLYSVFLLLSPASASQKSLAQYFGDNVKDVRIPSYCEKKDECEGGGAAVLIPTITICSTVLETSFIPSATISGLPAEINAACTLGVAGGPIFKGKLLMNAAWNESGDPGGSTCSSICRPEYLYGSGDSGGTTDDKVIENPGGANELECAGSNYGCASDSGGAAHPRSFMNACDPGGTQCHRGRSCSSCRSRSRLKGSDFLWF